MEPMNIDNSLTYLSSLSDEINLHIFLFLSDEDLACRVSSVCKKFLQISSDDALWKRRSVCLMGGDLGQQFLNVYRDWKVAYFNFKKMNQKGLVISPIEIRGLSGSYWLGQFWKGDLHGIGKIKLGNEVHDGEFKQGLLNGNGKLSYSGLENSLIILEGEFKDGQLNGKGKITSTRDGIKIGTFKNGCLEGEGLHKFPNGMMYQGLYTNGKLNGRGEIIHPNGIIEKGTFSEGVLISAAKISFLVGKNEIMWQFENVNKAHQS